MYHLDQLEFGHLPDSYCTFEGLESGGGKLERETHGAEVWGKLGGKHVLCSDSRIYQEKTVKERLFLSEFHQKEQEEVLSDFKCLENSYSDLVFQSSRSVSIQSEVVDTTEVQKEAPSLPLSSLGLLKNFKNRFQQFPYHKIYESRHDSEGIGVNKTLSTLEIIKLAAENFIQSSSKQIDKDNFSVLFHPFANSFACLSVEETRDVELIQYLLAAAEQVGQRQYVQAIKLLYRCEEVSSSLGNPIQRLVYYFSEALREKIDLETGRISSNSLGKKQMFDCEEAMVKFAPPVVSFHQKVPFYQVCQFAGVQAIVENVEKAKKIHIIDLEIRNGIQCTVLMQALAARHESVEHLKITAIGMTSKPTIEETGKNLTEFALSVNLPFSFQIVMVSDFLEVNENIFEIDPEEAVAVYSPWFLWSLISQPDRLEHLMKVMRNIKPCVFAIAEIEANINSPIFVTRFTEALFLQGVFFDAIEVCMAGDDQNRLSNESILFRQSIRNTLAAEGEKRVIRHVGINVWRSFFARFGMVEIELSSSSLYQASLVINDFSCGSYCTLDKNGECLTIGWKGTPLFSLSAWKFSCGKLNGYGTQTLAEYVRGAEKVHIIDTEIRNGRVNTRIDAITCSSRSKSLAS